MGSQVTVRAERRVYPTEEAACPSCSASPPLRARSSETTTVDRPREEGRCDRDLSSENNREADFRRTGDRLQETARFVGGGQMFTNLWGRVGAFGVGVQHLLGAGNTSFA